MPDITRRLSEIETELAGQSNIIEGHGRAIDMLARKDAEQSAVVAEFSHALKEFVSDNAEGRAVLERMLAGILLHRGWLAAVAIASSAPAWAPYAKPLIQRLTGWIL